MKMVKKVLMGLTVLATALVIAGCKMPEDDDKNIIKGSLGNYTVNYTYSDAEDATDTYRAYKSTALSHAGALVKITFNKPDTADIGASKVGVIFGLTEHKNANKVTLKDFNIIGIGTTSTDNYYVSTMTDIEDIQANNFGATVNAATGPSEREWVKLSNGDGTLPAKTDGKITVYIWYQATTDCTYKWAILDMTDDQAKAWKNMKDSDKAAANIPTATKTIAQGTITDAFELKDGKVPQYPISIYTMVKGEKTLDASIKVVGDYLEAEDAE